MNSGTVYVYGRHMDVREMLEVLGPGGTREIADRVLAVWPTSAPPVDRRIGGLMEVARALGVTTQQAGHWIAGRRGPGGFPEPLVVLAATSVWDLDVVLAWAELHGLIKINTVGESGKETP